MYRRTIKHNIYGLTLMELSIVMLVIGVVMGVIWAAAGAVYGSNRITTTQKQIMEIVQRTRSLHGMTQGMMLDMGIQGAPGAVTLAQAGAVPGDMVDNPASPTAVKHAWGQDVTFSAMNTLVNGDSFRIGLVDVPRWVCGDLLVRVTGAERDPGMLRVGTSTQMYDISDFPLSIIDATTACPGDTETVLFEFRLKS